MAAPKAPKLTHKRLLEVLTYEPTTGSFFWHVRPEGTKTWNTRFAGKLAGVAQADGYLRIVIDRESLAASHVAWFYMTGRWPTTRIDHRDLDKSNNEWGNLREATSSQNSANLPAFSTNKSGLKGAWWNKRKRKWESRICVQGQKIWLGLFDTPEAAAAAYAIAAQKHFGEFARAA